MGNCISKINSACSHLISEYVNMEPEMLMLLEEDDSQSFFWTSAELTAQGQKESETVWKNIEKGSKGWEQRGNHAEC